ncbi:MAG TPA: ABC transporter permease [Alloprevotella sp.]|nr:ABC transporter permease [Alloprevotella sp.]
MKQKLLKYWKQSYEDWNVIFREELRNIFRDSGVLIFFILVPLAYPLLYSFIYTNEVVREVPVAVVDADRSATSRDYLRRTDATADIRIAAYCANMEEARELLKHREVYGIIYIPSDFTSRLSRGEQSYVSLFSDMSGMLYYKAVLTSNTNVSLDMNARIKVARAGNTTQEQDKVTEHPIAYEEVSLYNPQNGFAAFLIPAVLMLILQQTLLLGVGISAGTAREHNAFRNLLPVSRHYTGLLRIVLGKSWAYLLVYIPISVYVLGVVPRLFRLNQIGAPQDIALFALPYLLACIFFAMTVSVLVRHRETCIMLIVFSSIPLLFLSGVSWPGSALPAFWKGFSYFFPSTFGVNGFLKINNMGGELTSVRTEWTVLWAQAIVYFLTTCLVYRNSIIASRRRFIARYRELKARKKA